MKKCKETFYENYMTISYTYAITKQNIEDSFNHINVVVDFIVYFFFAWRVAK